IKRTYEAKRRQMYIGAKESFLINVLAVIFRASEVNGKAKDRSVIALDELLEGCGIALLRCPNQPRVIQATGSVFSRASGRGQYTDAIYVVRCAADLACFRHDTYPINCSCNRRTGATPSAQHRLR